MSEHCGLGTLASLVLPDCPGHCGVVPPQEVDQELLCEDLPRGAECGRGSECGARLSSVGLTLVTPANVSCVPQISSVEAALQLRSV